MIFASNTVVVVKVVLCVFPRYRACRGMREEASMGHYLPIG